MRTWAFYNVWMVHDVRRWLLAGAGVLAVGLGALGAVLPGLPTTIFLLIASYCFARSCPWLEQRLLRNRLFAPYMAWIDGRERMSARAKLATIATIWVAVSVSLALLHGAGRLGPWLAAILIGSAAIGSLAVAMDLLSRLSASPELLHPHVHPEEVDRAVEQRRRQ